MSQGTIVHVRALVATRHAHFDEVGHSSADAYMSAMPAIFNGATAASEMTELRNHSLWSQFVYRCCLTLLQLEWENPVYVCSRVDIAVMQS